MAVRVPLVYSPPDIIKEAVPKFSAPRFRMPLLLMLTWLLQFPKVPLLVITRVPEVTNVLPPL